MLVGIFNIQQYTGIFQFEWAAQYAIHGLDLYLRSGGERGREKERERERDTDRQIDKDRQRDRDRELYCSNTCACMVFGMEKINCNNTNF